METDRIKTCQNCSVAKIRCHRSQLEGPCDRCRRLHKDCAFRPARRRLNQRPRDSHNDPLASIEAKLDQLLSYHEAGQPESAASASATPDVCDVMGAGLVSSKAAEYYIELYKSNLTPHFPFVVIHPDVSAEQLRQERPLLFLAVLTAAAFGDVPVQRSLAKRMRDALGQSVAGHGDMSFEMLQALLVHIAWTQFHPHPKRYTQYLQFAISVIVDQRLERPPRSFPLKTHVGASVDDHIVQPPLRSNDVLRAVAGCYYLSSTVSTLLQKLNTFQYTDYIGDCCKALSATPEFPTDKFLHSIIQLQRSMESIDPYPFAIGSATTADIPEVDYSRIQVDLENLRMNMPFTLNESCLVFMLFHAVQLHAVQMRLFLSGLRAGVSNDIQELDEGFKAANALFGYYLSLPLRRESTFNNSEWLQLSFALTVGAKLMFAASDHMLARAAKELRASLDMSAIFRQVLLRLNALEPPAADGPEEPDVFRQYGQRVKRMQTWFEDRFVRAQECEQATGLSGTNERAGHGGPQMSGGEMLLPELQPLGGLGAYDAQLASFFPHELQTAYGWSDWAAYPNFFGH
ncbi:hypothetical protein B0J12DRAFT_446624 [Macrophomina phaseolina]|uniref:Zn(2)-C6 fungal-type domain-containing protein n=1 Tax=Macrophomina phaseolina TaxID=35725 RepID=A0ABQ8FT85_9PEZI|nr:hypothetical protein B0J12DRAFT_446624 [Macrophomina phaseolina]